MNATDWIMAVCAILTIIISIWSLIISMKNKNEIVKIKQNLTVINHGSHGNIVNVGNANNNGVAGVIID